MGIITQISKVSDLSRQEYLAHKRLSFRFGIMRQSLPDLHTNSDYFYTQSYTLTLKDQDSGQILAWALVRFAKDKRTGPDFNVYVRSSARRKGYGTQLLNLATEKFGKLRCYPHDKDSRKFYKSRPRQNFAVARYYSL